MADAARSSLPSYPNLWRHRDFMMLWSGQTVSELGSAVTTIALPLTAVVLLHASTLQVGLLTAASTVSFLIVALPAGLVVDRVAKRRLMIGCDVARMLIIGSVPVAAALGVLTMAQLFAVALLAGLATVFFDVAYQSYVPALIEPEQLHDGNGKLGATQAFAQVTGPGLGGGLFGLVGAGSMIVDAVSYAVSFLSLLLIRVREPRPDRSETAATGVAGLRTEILAGLAFVFRQPVLRKIAACTGTGNLFSSMAGTLEIIFLIRVLHVSPADTGLLVAVGSVGGIAGGVLSSRLSRWIGSARIIWFSVLVFGAIPVVMPLAEPGPRLEAAPRDMEANSCRGTKRRRRRSGINSPIRCPSRVTVKACPFSALCYSVLRRRDALAGMRSHGSRLAQQAIRPAIRPITHQFHSACTQTERCGGVRPVNAVGNKCSGVKASRPMNASAAGAPIAPPRSCQRVRAARAAAVSAMADQARSSAQTAAHGNCAADRCCDRTSMPSSAAASSNWSQAVSPSSGSASTNRAALVSQAGAGSDAVRFRCGSASRNATAATSGTKAARTVSVMSAGCRNGSANW
jgi:MFS family permease